MANGNNFVAVPGINVNIPGVLPNTLTVGLKVIQPAQRAKGPVNAPVYNTVAKTSQVVLQVKLNLAPLGLNVPSTTSNFTAGNGTATLKEIDCAAPSIDVTGQTSGATTPANVVGTLLGIPLLGTLNVNGTIAAAASTDRTFMYPTQFLPPVGPQPGRSRTTWAWPTSAWRRSSPRACSSAGRVPWASWSGLVEPVLETVVTTLDSVLVPTLGPILKVLGLDLAGADFSAVNIFDPPPSCSSTKLVK